MAKHAIGGKTLNSGLRGGLWEAKHWRAMGDAVWLFGWLVHRQTSQRNGSGLVLRGKALTYADISDDTGWPRRTLQRWMARLRGNQCIEVKHSIYGRMVIRILKAKKFNPKQLEFPAVPAPSSAPDVAQVSAPTLAQVYDKGGALKERDLSIEQKKIAAANAADPRFQKIVDHYFSLMRAKRIEPRFDQSDGKQLSTWLKGNRNRPIESLLKTLENAFQSTDPYPLRPGFRLREFLAHEAKYQRGPLHRQSRKAQETQAGDEIVKLEVPE